jgi:hypothetical protein
MNNNKLSNLLFILVFALLLDSCTTTQSAKVSGLTAELTGDAGKIKLLPHQKTAIDYLASRDDVKGLLVNHQMGTGKTYLAIGFAERLPDREVIVIAPRFIEAHWESQIETFGVKNRNRYHFVSYNEAPQKLQGKDLSKTIIILDECHNIVRFLKSQDMEQNKTYSEFYIHLRSAYKILGLTGTPIYNDEFDLAYVFNLVSGKDLVPFNEEEFRLQYTRINRGRAFFRGHLTESLVFGVAFPAMIATAATVLTLGPIALLAAVPAGLLFPAINYWWAPLDKFKLREFDVKKFKPVTNKYVSYYEIPEENFSDFPSQTMHIREVDYSGPQVEFFLNFAEGNLANAELLRLMSESKRAISPEYVNLNSTILQTHMRNTIGSGREIGNLSFAEGGKIVEPPKFLELLATLRNNTGDFQQTVVYSNYFDNGTLAFAQFLDRQGLKDKYEILRPELSVAAQRKLLQNYNTGVTKILLLHPEITEGISLKGTRRFHLLEPVLNSTILKQVVARSVRYQSHAHLPKEQRHVDVYMWKSLVGKNYTAYNFKKENWVKRYSELSDWSQWGNGLQQIDKNFARKAHSPDEAAFMKLEFLNDNIAKFKEILLRYSIETSGVTKG